MSRMDLKALLAILVLMIGTAKADAGGVLFWRTDFTMLCPEKGTWFKNGKEIQKDLQSYSVSYDSQSKGLYHCQYNGNEEPVKYYFYIEGKFCANCFELNAKVFAVVIVADIILTAFVMVMTYKYTKKKSSPESRSSKAAAHSGGRGPPTPSPDYEQLNPRMLDDPYSIVKRTR
ncbi:T-cell surface glycoprotein CD3 epsilon chain-like [Aulostomus maculatus]